MKATLHHRGLQDPWVLGFCQPVQPHFSLPCPYSLPSKQHWPSCQWKTRCSRHKQKQCIVYAHFYHHVPAALNNVGDKILLSPKIFCWSRLQSTATITLSFNNIYASFKWTYIYHSNILIHIDFYMEINSNNSRLYGGPSLYGDTWTQLYAFF